MALLTVISIESSDFTSSYGALLDIELALDAFIPYFDTEGFFYYFRLGYDTETADLGVLTTDYATFTCV